MTVAVFYVHIARRMLEFQISHGGNGDFARRICFETRRDRRYRCGGSDGSLNLSAIENSHSEFACDRESFLSVLGRLLQEAGYGDTRRTFGQLTVMAIKTPKGRDNRILIDQHAVLDDSLCNRKRNGPCFDPASSACARMRAAFRIAG